MHKTRTTLWNIFSVTIFSYQWIDGKLLGFVRKFRELGELNWYDWWSFKGWLRQFRARRISPYMRTSPPSDDRYLFASLPSDSIQIGHGKVSIKERREIETFTIETLIWNSMIVKITNFIHRWSALKQQEENSWDL